MGQNSASPIAKGLRGLCPECGEGSIFDGFLKFAPRCEACGASFDNEDAGDGPAVFVIFAAGIFVIPAALAFQLITNAPTWLTMVIWVPILIVFCLALMRPLRGIMFNLQWKHGALEHRAKKPDAKDEKE